MTDTPTKQPLRIESTMRDQFSERSSAIDGRPTKAQREQLESDGFVIVDDAVDPELVPRLRDAARRAGQRVESDLIDRHMLTPRDGEPVFGEYYGSAPLLRYCAGWLQRPISELALAEFCLFYRPPGRPAINRGWHRDSVWWREQPGLSRHANKMDLSNYDEAVEREVWVQGQWDRRPGSPRHIEAQRYIGFHLALVDDDCFEIVPGSHRRFRTESEKECLMDFNGLGPGKTRGLTAQDDLPGSVRVALKAGQTMFWDGDTIHRGNIRPNQERLTLHCGWGAVDRQGDEQSCDPRFLLWTHPGVRDYLLSVNGCGDILAVAWDNFMSMQIVPPEVVHWNATHAATENLPSQNREGRRLKKLYRRFGPKAGLVTKLLRIIRSKE